MRAFLILCTFLPIFVAGCGGGGVLANQGASSLIIAPHNVAIDTNCTGCNATNALGRRVQRFTLAAGSTGEVRWSVAGGDTVSGPGTINSAGEYTPPSYLTADQVQVVVTATLPNAAGRARLARTVLAVTPGFLQPLAPQNAALGPNGQIVLTGFLAEAGGGESIHFALSNSPDGTEGGAGTLGASTCQRTGQTFTSCRVNYTAPPAIQGAAVTYLVASVGISPSRAIASILLNSAGVTSNPALHQVQMPAQVQLGASGGNNNDYDTAGNQIVDCCSGTLGALVQDAAGRAFVLSNNHVFARSDHAAVGDSVVQPGLIDNNCTPGGESSGTTPIASLTSWLPLSASSTNADAALAQVVSRSVDPSGSILEFGPRQSDGTLAAAPPGISSSGGKGEGGSLGLPVAKSGRTTGLTCGTISAVDVDVHVDYYLDCAETRHYLTKTFTGQLALSGNSFSDSGDSGALVVDSANAEPVGLYFAGGVDAEGVSQAMANPASDVLRELGSQSGSNISFTFVGGADHPVSCLSYGNSTVPSVQARTLSASESDRTQQALAQARLLVNPNTGILGVALGKSSDAAGEGAILMYVDQSKNVTVPITVGGVRTEVISATASAVAAGSAPQFAQFSPGESLDPAALAGAISIKRQIARSLLDRNPSFFAIGVGRSLDNPREPALVIYVDRNHMPSRLPQTIAGLRTHFIVMDRLHVTRAYASRVDSRNHCMAHPAPQKP